jgi:hypothetical protein
MRSSSIVDIGPISRLMNAFSSKTKLSMGSIQSIEPGLTCLKLSGRSIGFLINWKVARTKDGIQRMIRHERYHEAHINIFFAVFEVFAV